MHQKTLRGQVAYTYQESHRARPAAESRGFRIQVEGFSPVPAARARYPAPRAGPSPWAVPRPREPHPGAEHGYRASNPGTPAPPLPARRDGGGHPRRGAYPAGSGACDQLLQQHLGGGFAVRADFAHRAGAGGTPLGARAVRDDLQRLFQQQVLHGVCLCGQPPTPPGQLSYTMIVGRSVKGHLT